MRLSTQFVADRSASPWKRTCEGTGFLTCALAATVILAVVSNQALSSPSRPVVTAMIPGSGSRFVLPSTDAQTDGAVALQRLLHRVHHISPVYQVGLDGSTSGKAAKGPMNSVRAVGLKSHFAVIPSGAKPSLRLDSPRAPFFSNLAGGERSTGAQLKPLRGGYAFASTEQSDILRSVTGSEVGEIAPVRTALVSVFDKSGLEELGPFLAAQGIHVLSTGGTAAKLRELGCTVQDVADYTGSPEILDGRVKTLHPKVHGGLLAVRGKSSHDSDVEENGIRPIDLVVSNLYPFEQAVKKESDYFTCIENIDIGGPAMIRAAAKNHAAVAILTSPAQYKPFMEQMGANAGGTTYDFRKNLAAEAYAVTAAYDASTSSWLAGQVSSPPTTQSIAFKVERPLKYGTNPHQLPAAVCSVGGKPLPFEVVSGTPGYINLLDAVNAWQLVKELAQATGLPAAASFKHVSPAGAAIGVPLSEAEKAVYEVVGKELTPTAAAYVRARNADPLCSYGDFVAISHEVDLATANLLKIEVSDGIIAPGFEEAALDILKAKKKGKFIILKADPSFEPPDAEYRMISGVGFVQKRNDALFEASKLEKIVTNNKDLPAAAKNDLVLASIAIKYTQSNSVGYAKDGMMLGVGAGQQSRVDCVKLAGRKVATWRLRFHEKVRNLPFREGVKRQARVNARVRYIEGDMQESELKEWQKNFDGPVEPLTEAERSAFIAELDGVSISSDAFFPFRDSIDFAAKYGVKYVAEPGGSVADEEVVAACNTYGMVMAFTNLRLFHH